MGKARRQVFEWLSVTLLLVFTAVTGSADTTATTAGTGTPLPAQSGFTAPTFKGGALQMNNLFTSCINLNPILNPITDALKGRPSSASSIAAGATAGGCAGDETGPDISTLDCKSYMSSSGTFNSASLKQVKDQLDAALGTISCKLTKVDGIRTELGCLTNQADTLSQQAGLLQDAFVQNIQRMEQDVAKVKGQEADRDNQLTDVGNKLIGDKSNGTQGWLKLQEATHAMVDQQMPAEIQGFKESQNKAVIDQQNFTQQVEVRTMVLTTQCFTTQAQPQWRCTPNGPPVTARDYVLCRYQQNQNLGAGGTILQDSTTSTQAGASAQGLSALIDTILGGAPVTGKMPTSADQAQAQAEQPIAVLNMADIESQFGDQLSQFNGKGLDIHSFVMQAMGNCFNNATTVVARERSRSGTDLGATQEKIKQEVRMNSTQANTLMNKYANQFNQDMSALTGGHFPLNTSLCQNAQPNVQANCLDDLQTNLKGLLYGNVPQSAVSIIINGQSPINVKCQGLDGCVTQLQNVSTNLVWEKTKLAQFRKDYILQANQGIQGFVKQSAGVLSIQSQALSNRVKSLNSTLAGLGVDGTIDLKPGDGEELTPDDDGLFKVPKSAVKVIGAAMNPPMLDVQGNNFSDALKGVASRVQDLNKEQGTLRSSQAQLATFQSGCMSGQQGTRLAQLQTFTDRIATLGCTSDSNFCAKSNQDVLKSLSDSVNGLMGQSGFNQSDIDSIQSNLTAGMNCPPSGDAQKLNPTNCTSVTTNLQKQANYWKNLNDFTSSSGNAGGN